MMLDKYEPIDVTTMNTMLGLADFHEGVSHIELGSGNGQFVEAVLSRGAISHGYEIDPALVKTSRAKEHITLGDCFDADVSSADVVTCWFTLLPGTDLLLDKLYSEMKLGSRLVKAGNTPHAWEPVKQFRSGDHWINVYVK